MKKLGNGAMWAGSALIGGGTYWYGFEGPGAADPTLQPAWVAVIIAAVVWPALSQLADSMRASRKRAQAAAKRQAAAAGRR